jgi:hypothetical protein
MTALRIKQNRQSTTGQYSILTLMEDSGPFEREKKSFTTVCIINVSRSCLNILVKNMKVTIEKYFNWWISIKLVCVRYENY